MAGNLTAMIASIFSGSAVTADPYYEYTTLLLPGNGTNGAQNNTFLDGSTNNFTITRNGNTTQGTFSPFSQTGWGNYFNGSSGYFTTPANAAFAFGTGDFTVEMFVNTSNLTTGGFVSHGPAATSGYWAFELQTGSFYWQASGVANILVVSASSYLSNSVWTHLCVSRFGRTLRMFANGTLIGSTTDNTNYSGSSSGSLSIGRSYNNLYTTGYISNLRIVKGTGVTTVTVPTAPLTAISGTSILTCQSNRFVDNSSNAFALTLSGSPTVQAFSPFNPTASWSAATNGGSGYFDGSGDYLTGPTNTATAFNLTGDFTIESWCYFSSVSTAFAGILSYADSSGFNGWELINNAGTVYFRFLTGSAGAGQVTASSSITTNQWYHIAVSRSGSTITLYINGYSVGTVTYSSSQSSSSSFIKVAADRIGSTLSTGYLSNIRVVNGTAFYTSNFTPPTAPLTAITNTSLLLNFTNAGIYDATSKNDLETVGNAQISTTQSKWGGSSISFDGTGDWLLIPDQPPQRIGTGNFTVEMWVYRNSSGTYGLAGKGTGTTGWLVSLNSSNQVVFTYGSSTITSTGTVSATTWTHIAVVREGTSTNQTKIYINGTNDGTGTVSTDFNQINSMYIGADRTGGSAANAYVQDVRITNYARYTSNFTPPTAAFPTL
jgi:hypothetical protein